MTIYEKQKEEAIKRMEKLGIYKPYINKFKTSDTKTLFENYGGYYIDENTENNLQSKIARIEIKYDILIYAVIHDYTAFGELYSCLCVTKDEEEWEYDREDLDSGIVFAYVINIDEEAFSEFRSIGVQSFGGGLKRVG